MNATIVRGFYAIRRRLAKAAIEWRSTDLPRVDMLAQDTPHFFDCLRVSYQFDRVNNSSFRRVRTHSRR
jgi:hypothetical protein